MKNIDYNYLFDNLKNGDSIGFHYKEWYYIFAKIIKFFTYNTSESNKLAIEHIGICYNVVKIDNELIFYFGEQLTATGRTNNQIVIKKEPLLMKNGVMSYGFTVFKNSKATTHLFGKNIQFYLLELKHDLTPYQNNVIARYFDETEKYSVKSAIASVPFFQKIFKVKDKNKDNYCSGAVHTALQKCGIGLDIKDTLPSPAELSTFDYIKKIFKING